MSNLELERKGVNRYIDTMTIWEPRLEGRKGPRYRAIVRGSRRGRGGRGIADGQPPAHPPRAGRSARRHRGNGEPGLLGSRAPGAGLGRGGTRDFRPGRGRVGRRSRGRRRARGSRPEPPAGPGRAPAADRAARSARYPDRAGRRGAAARLPGRRGKRGRSRGRGFLDRAGRGGGVARARARLHRQPARPDRRPGHAARAGRPPADGVADLRRVEVGRGPAAPAAEGAADGRAGPAARGARGGLPRGRREGPLPDPHPAQPDDRGDARGAPPRDRGHRPRPRPRDRGGRRSRAAAARAPPPDRGAGAGAVVLPHEHVEDAGARPAHRLRAGAAGDGGSTRGEPEGHHLGGRAADGRGGLDLDPGRDRRRPASRRGGRRRASVRRSPAIGWPAPSSKRSPRPTTSGSGCRSRGAATPSRPRRGRGAFS